MISKDELKLREDICQIAKMMYAREFIGGPAGNISARLDEDRFLLTPSTPFKQLLTPEQLIIIDSSGKKVGPHTDANRDLNPTSEVPMHLAAYHTRSDVGAVLHGHLSYCVALTAAGKTIRPQVMTEAMLFLGDIGVASYATPTTQELGDNVARVVVDHDCVILPYHGVIVASTDLWAAAAKMEVLEQAAQINCLVNQMGGEKPLDPEHIAGMLALRKKMGMDLPSDANLLKA
ncbi:MAG: class II aldolase/adducin family protein [bacterium]|nr:class II aldolase/adducin family protein [bacterium]